MLLITLTGSHFAPHAVLMIDGRPVGKVNQSTPVQLVALISNRNPVWPPDEHALSIHKPDGTAAQIVLGEDDQERDQQASNYSKLSAPEHEPDGDFDD